MKILSLFNIVLVISYAIGALFIFPDFENLFIELEQELPKLTSIVLTTYPYWLLASVIPVGIYITCLRSENLIKAYKTALYSVLIIMAVCLCLLLPIVIYALYLPVFQLEAVGG